MGSAKHCATTQDLSRDRYTRTMRLLLITIAFAGSLSGADLCGSIRNLVGAESQKQAIPAISVAVVRDNRLVCSLALGLADLEQRIPNKEKSRHRLASLSKPVSATLTMRLVEEGRVAQIGRASCRERV